METITDNIDAHIEEGLSLDEAMFESSPALRGAEVFGQSWSIAIHASQFVA